MSYSHRHISDGNLYKKIGFEHTRITGPSYLYTKNYREFMSRITFQKHKLSNILEKFDVEKTEWENMQANGYDRIWDCGNDVWVLNINKEKI
jgi:ribosomal protein L33